MDEDAGCDGPWGRYFAVLTKKGASWRSVVSDTTSTRALANCTAGWLRAHMDGLQGPEREISGKVVAIAPRWWLVERAAVKGLA